MLNYAPIEIYLARLSKEIEQFNTVLQVYTKRTDAKQTYVQQRIETINRLIEIYNGIESEFQSLGIIYPIAQLIHDLMKRDPEIGIVTIQLQINPKKKGMGLIQCNPFSK